MARSLERDGHVGGSPLTLPSPPWGEGPIDGPLSLGRERAGVRVWRQFANYPGWRDSTKDWTLTFSCSIEPGVASASSLRWGSFHRSNRSFRTAYSSA